MLSQFTHQHASDYMSAWMQLSDMCTFKPKEEQVAILTHCRETIRSHALERSMEIGCHDLSFTETELAQLAAIDEHINRRQSPFPNHVFVVKIGS